MKRRVAFLILIFFSVFFTVGAVFAQRGGGAQEVIEVRLASPLPRNSDWGRGLERIAADWLRVTNNQVRLRVIHDGLEGGEGKMLTSLNANNIQAGLFTSAGLSEICPAVVTLSVPFLIRNEVELDRVLDKAVPFFEDKLSKTNYVAICWSKGGWINIFSKEAVVTPDDLRRQRLGTSTELKDINITFRTMGFQIVETDVVDLGTKLASNMINSLYLIPEAIVPMGLHRNLSNMLDMSLAPVMGAIIMNRVTWNKLGAARQRSIVEVTRKFAIDFETSMAKTSANAIAAMRKDGLKINKPSQAQEEMWRVDVTKAMTTLIGTTIDRDLYNQINDILAKVRSGQ
ncbi:MAG: TRAP transporter substrate-binding protein DctP [Treponema sp.]|jgi:TRAP-type C4-dicarboxylate transport system substrate-binding protein|nr:TRAP transporter substrate-binding protein DctP [Treponema sp.]